MSSQTEDAPDTAQDLGEAEAHLASDPTDDAILTKLEADARAHMGGSLAANLALGDTLNHAIDRHNELGVTIGQYKLWVNRVCGVTYQGTMNYRRGASRFPLGPKRDRILGLLPTVVYELARHDDDRLVRRALDNVRRGKHVNRDTIRAWTGENENPKTSATSEPSHITENATVEVEKDHYIKEALSNLAALLLELDEGKARTILHYLEALDFDALPLKEKMGWQTVDSPKSLTEKAVSDSSRL